MYNISVKIPIEREPWKIPFEYRKARVLKSIFEGKKIAIMFYHTADTSTFRYRCYNPMQTLNDSNIWDSVYFFREEIKQIYDLIPKVSMLIFVRIKWEYIVDDLVRRVRNLKIPILFDIDDLVCNIRYIKTVTNTLNVHFGGEVDYDFWFSYISRLEYTASLVDGFITTNNYLGERLEDRFNKPYQIIPNSINQEQLKASERCLSIKNKTKFTSPFTIGYFSGTPSHINDFRTVYSEILSFLHDFPDSILLVVGFMEFPESMQPYIKNKQVQYMPLVDFVELQRLIAQVDVNIVPLVENIFTNCKSELKFFEAAIVETPTIAAPIYTYRSAITDGETGFLCQPGQMYERLKQLYNDRVFAKQMAGKARDYCLREYTGKKVLDSIETAYNYFM